MLTLLVYIHMTADTLNMNIPNRIILYISAKNYENIDRMLHFTGCMRKIYPINTYIHRYSHDYTVHMTNEIYNNTGILCTTYTEMNYSYETNCRHVCRNVMLCTFIELYICIVPRRSNSIRSVQASMPTLVTYTLDSSG